MFGVTHRRRGGTAPGLLRAVPYLLVHGMIPPRAVATDILKGGLYDAGMSGGGEWEPSELSPAE